MGSKTTKSKRKKKPDILGRLGEWIQRLTPSQISELVALMGVSYYGYAATKDLRGSLAAVIGLKLATTEGGTPPASQIAGLAILGGIGLASLVKGPQYQSDVFGVPVPQYIPPPEEFLPGGEFSEGWVPVVPAKSNPGVVGYGPPEPVVVSTGFSGWGPGSLYAYRQSVRESIGTSGHGI